jgi:hypothetical protein
MDPALIGVQDEDSCGRSGQCETPEAIAEEAHGSPAESEVLHGNHKRHSEILYKYFSALNSFYKISPNNQKITLWIDFDTIFNYPQHLLTGFSQVQSLWTI